MSVEPAAPSDLERLLQLLYPVLTSESLEVVLAQGARLIGGLTQSFATAVFVVQGGDISGEAWSTEDEVRRLRLRPHFRGIVLASIAQGAPAIVPFPSSMVTGLEPRVLLLRARGRLLGAVCIASLPDGEGAEPHDAAVVEQLADLLAHRIVTIMDAGAAQASHTRYERWFRQLDLHIRVLDKERQKFAAVVNQSDTYVFVADRTHTIRWANRAMSARFPVGGPASSWIGRACNDLWSRFVEPPIDEHGGCPVARALERNQVVHRELRQPGEGVPRDLYLTALPIKGPDGVPQEVLVMVQDLSDLALLRGSERRHRQLFERSPNGILVVDPDQQRILLANPAACALFGLPDAAISGHGCQELHAGLAPDLCARIAAVAADETLHFAAQSVRGADGAPRFADIWASRFDFDGRAGVLIEFRDVTERRNAEQKLNEIQNRMSAVVSNAPLVVFATDAEGVITLSEGRGLERLGRAPGESVGKSLFELYAHVPEAVSHVRRALAGEEFTAMIDVGAVTFETHYAPIRDASGAPCGMSGIATDVTERRRLEEQVRQARNASEFESEGQRLDRAA